MMAENIKGGEGAGGKGGRGVGIDGMTGEREINRRSGRDLGEGEIAR
jgi:hypothetical protein